MEGRGNFRGSGILGAIEWYVRQHGAVAAQSAYSKMPAAFRAQMLPHHATLGIFGSRVYSYAFVGELLRQLGVALKVRDEDAFLREITFAGMEATLGTVNRIALMHVVTYDSYLSRAQRVWDLYHDAGRVKIVEARPKELLVDISDWPAHDVTVCKVCLYAREAVLTKMGHKMTVARREYCQALGHASCGMLYRWE